MRQTPPHRSHRDPLGGHKRKEYEMNLMWFNRNGHYVKLNYQKGEVSDESEATKKILRSIQAGRD